MISNHDLSIIIFAGIIGIGAYLVYDFQQVSVIPLESAVINLEKIQYTTDTSHIVKHVLNAKDGLPKTGNPVWFYPTVSTDFKQIQSSLDGIVSVVDKITYAPADSSSFHVGIQSIQTSADQIKDRITDAKPFVIFGFPNMLFNSVWIFGMLGLTESLLRRTA